jgi:putative acetyltransferase
MRGRPMVAAHGRTLVFCGMTVRFEVVSADPSPALLKFARTLMGEYAAMPHINGRWDTAPADIAALPLPFVAPAGVLLVAFDGEAPLGCGALLTLEPGIVEMKRVYVREAARGCGVGESLVRTLLGHADALGCPRVRLDTAPELLTAQALYRRLGFVPIPPYQAGLLPDTLFFERVADNATTRPA